MTMPCAGTLLQCWAAAAAAAATLPWRLPLLPKAAKDWSRPLFKVAHHVDNPWPLRLCDQAHLFSAPAHLSSAAAYPLEATPPSSRSRSRGRSSHRMSSSGSRVADSSETPLRKPRLLLPAKARRPSPLDEARPQASAALEFLDHPDATLPLPPPSLTTLHLASRRRRRTRDAKSVRDFCLALAPAPAPAPLPVQYAQEALGEEVHELMAKLFETRDPNALALVPYDPQQTHLEPEVTQSAEDTLDERLESEQGQMFFAALAAAAFLGTLNLAFR